MEILLNVCIWVGWPLAVVSFIFLILGLRADEKDPDGKFVRFVDKWMLAMVIFAVLLMLVVLISVVNRG
jgi:hypothetical protein